MATTRQKTAAKKLSENIGNKGSKKSMGEILKEAGYSDSVSKTPSRVTKSKGWQELMEEYFPAEYLMKIHKKILNKKEIISYRGEYIKTRQPHSDVKYALEMLYKMKGYYKEDSYNEEITGLEKLSDKELDQLYEELKSGNLTYI